MIGVGCKGSKKGKVRVLARYEDNDMDSAVAMAESLAKHNRGEFLVFLIIGNNSYKVLKRVKKTLSVRVPTPRHPFRFPSFDVKVR